MTALDHDHGFFVGTRTWGNYESINRADGGAPIDSEMLNAIKSIRDDPEIRGQIREFVSSRAADDFFKRADYLIANGKVPTMEDYPKVGLKPGEPGVFRPPEPETP